MTRTVIIVNKVDDSIITPPSPINFLLRLEDQPVSTIPFLRRAKSRVNSNVSKDEIDGGGGETTRERSRRNLIIRSARSDREVAENSQASIVAAKLIKVAPPTAT